MGNTLHADSQRQSGIALEVGVAFYYKISTPLGDSQQRCIRESSARGLTPYPFMYHFWQKRHPFLIPSIDKWYPLRVEPSRLGHYREYHLGNILTTFVVNINCLSLSFSRSSLFITTRNILREWICLWKVDDITVVIFLQFFVRSFPLVNDRVREALGDTFYEEFMVRLENLKGLTVNFLF